MDERREESRGAAHGAGEADGMCMYARTALPPAGDSREGAPSFSRELVRVLETWSVLSQGAT